MVRQSGILSVLLAGFLALTSVGVVWATPVAVTNFSFELPLLADGAFVSGPAGPLGATVPGWQITTGQFGVINPTAAMFASVPNGSNTAFTNTGTLSQTLGATLLNSTRYTLTVAVGDRLDTPFGTYAIELFAGATMLGSASAPIPGNGLFATATVVYNSLAADPNAGQALRIALVGTGVQEHFDNVQLDASPIPEPSTLFLLGTGLLGLLGFARLGRKPIA